MAFEITTLTLPDGVMNEPYAAALASADGVAPVMWAVSAGSLPVGIVLNAATGVLTGIPTAVGTSTFTIEATDSDENTTTREFTVEIVGSVPVAPGTLLPVVDPEPAVLAPCVEELTEECIRARGYDADGCPLKAHYNFTVNIDLQH